MIRLHDPILKRRGAATNMGTDWGPDICAFGVRWEEVVVVTDNQYPSFIKPTWSLIFMN